MGRHEKFIIDSSGIDRRDTGYYSTPAFVAEFFSNKLLDINPTPTTILDPCVGKGELLEPFRNIGAKLYGYDILDLSPTPFYEFQKRDFLSAALDSLTIPLIATPINRADIIVANPPYNCHEHDYLRKHKAKLSRCFGSGVTLNLYSTFLAAIISVAKPGCLIGVITHDSFLTARGHEGLRRLIRNNCAIHSLLLCPTDLFNDQGADVRTTILIMEKGAGQSTNIEICPRPKNSTHFRRILRSDKLPTCTINDLSLTSEKDRGEFTVGVPGSVRALFDLDRLGDVFPCKTGISTGNDRLYLSRQCRDQFALPFYKNPGGSRFFAHPNAFLDKNYLGISHNVSNFIVRNKCYIGHAGITCSSMGVSFGAAILPKGSTFGVNANIFPDEGERWWLLSFLNSSLCNFIVRGVLLRSNMITAGYVSRIPLPLLNRNIRKDLGLIARQAYERAYEDKGSMANIGCFISQIDELLFEACQITKQDRDTISMFCADIIRRT